jgi:Tol biopolymer transport system component
MARSAVAGTSFSTRLRHRARTAMLAAACASAVVTAVVPAAEAAYPGRNGLLLFARDTTSLMTMRADGTGQRQVYSGYAEHANWSPSGREIAFDHFCGGQCANAVSSGTVLSTGLLGAVTTWAGGPVLPDEPPYDNPPHAQFWYYASWSPDGTKLVVADGRGLWLFTRDRFQRRLTRSAGTAHVEPSWSPDGKLVAFSRCTGVDPEGRGYTGCSIHVVDPSLAAHNWWGAPATQITPDGPNSHNPDWSPDSTKIAYEVGEYRGTGLGIWTVRPDGSDRRRVWPWGYTPAFAPDGTRIAIGSQAGIWTIRSDGTDLRRLTSDVRDRDPDWQPLR